MVDWSRRVDCADCAMLRRLALGDTFWSCVGVRSSCECIRRLQEFAKWLMVIAILQNGQQTVGRPKKLRITLSVMNDKLVAG